MVRGKQGKKCINSSLNIYCFCSFLCDEWEWMNEWHDIIVYICCWCWSISSFLAMIFNCTQSFFGRCQTGCLTSFHIPIVYTCHIDFCCCQLISENEKQVKIISNEVKNSLLTGENLDRVQHISMTLRPIQYFVSTMFRLHPTDIQA